MKHKKSFVRVVLITAWIAVNFACGGLSSKQANGGSSNVLANNNSSTANVAANDTTTAAKSDVKNVRFCTTLTDFVNGEYKKDTVNYKCDGKKMLTLPSGRTQELHFTGEGDAENVKNVSLIMTTKTEFKDNAEAEEALVKTCEQLWFEAFKAVLPMEIRNAMLADKGKAVEKMKNYADQNNASFIRHRTDVGRYGLNFGFDLPKQ